MKLQTVFTVLLLTVVSSALAAPATPPVQPANPSQQAQPVTPTQPVAPAQSSSPQPAVNLERLVRAYAHLKNAEQISTGSAVSSENDLLDAGKAMSSDALKRESGALTDRILARLSSAPANQRPEIFVHVKNAMLRLTLDREEPHDGHTKWAYENRSKVLPAIRECAQTIKEALAKF